MDWYCIDYWSRELGLNIGDLKRELEHLISIHPHVAEFLQTLSNTGRRVALLTNAHQQVIELKMASTGLAHHFDHLICSHAFRVPKEDPRFWPRLAEQDPFDPQTTLFVDDSLPVLRAARGFGIRFLRAVSAPDTRSPPRQTDEFTAIESFSELLEGLMDAENQE
jgi:putative hydrolase of the HAD superfamily